MTTKSRLGRALAMVSVAATLSFLAGCSGEPAPTTTATGGDLPSVIHVASIKDRTGPAAFAGLETNRGIELAVEEINESGKLGASKLEVDYQDPASDPTVASQLITTAIADPDIAAVFGPVLGTESIVVSPRAQQGGLPIIFSQSAATGTLTGDYTFRITPPPSSYNKILFDHLKKEGVKSFDILYTSDSAGAVEYAQTIWPTLAKDAGIEVGLPLGTPSALQDFSAPVAQLIANNPDAIGLDLQGAGFVTAAKEIHRQGYKGIVFGNSVIDGFMADIGADGEGIVWPTTWTPLNTSEASKTFVDAFGAKFNGDVPKNFAIEGYDSVYLLADAILASGSATREGIQQGLAQVTDEGFSGAIGDLTFEDGDARIVGTLLTWDGSKALLVK